MQNTQKIEPNLVKKRKRFNKLALKEWISAYLFLAPILIIFGYFVIYPMISYSTWDSASSNYFIIVYIISNL